MAKTAGTLSGRGNTGASNRRAADGSLGFQYFQNETQAYTQDMGEYASNVYAADCQGLNPDDFYGWRRVKIRSIRAAQAQTGETMPDDWQRIYLIDPARYTYIPQGAMLRYADNTWIVYKGKNMEAILGAAIVRRCNAVIHVLDWYGNVIAVPMSYAKMGTLGNAVHTTENTITSKNYMACICQLNEYSREFRENTRIILGNTAYAMRGLDNFTREFTDDPDSAHLITFTIERVEVQPYDSVELGVADYGGFSWELNVDRSGTMTAGTAQRLRVESRRNNAAVESTEEHPIGYLFNSSDESVITVDENGLVTAVAEGTASVTVTLRQNPGISRTVEIEVPAQKAEYTDFTTNVPEVLHEMESFELGAAYFLNGAKTMYTVEFTLSGPEEGAYGVRRLYGGEGFTSWEEITAGETVTGTLDTDSRILVTAYRASPTPLKVTVTSQGESAEAEIWLVT